MAVLQSFVHDYAQTHRFQMRSRKRPLPGGTNPDIQKRTLNLPIPITMGFSNHPEYSLYCC